MPPTDFGGSHSACGALPCRPESAWPDSQRSEHPVKLPATTPRPVLRDEQGDHVHTVGPAMPQEALASGPGTGPCLPVAGSARG